MSTHSTPAPDFPPEIQLNSPDGASAKISPYGAHVLSWIPAGGDEGLFLSPKAEFRSGAAIRGGVPVIFPQFAGMGNLPKHGFARNLLWEVARASADSATFWLSENADTHNLWPHRFLAEYKVQINASNLYMTLAITNIDVAPFTFTAALHTYLRVADVRRASVAGLSSLNFQDSANGGQELRENADSLTFPGEVDRIYSDALSPLQLVTEKQQILISAEGFPDAVLWNPGPEKCASLADMEPDGYLQFVCVEAAVIGQPVLLLPGQTWHGTQTLSAQ